MKKKQRYVLLPILAVATVLFITGCNLFQQLPSVIVQLKLTTFGIGAAGSVLPIIEFVEQNGPTYTAELSEYTSWDGSEGIFDINLDAASYDIAVNIDCTTRPNPAACTFFVYLGGITGGGTPIVTGSTGAYVVTFKGISVPSDGGTIEVVLD